MHVCKNVMEIFVNAVCSFSNFRKICTLTQNPLYGSIQGLCNSCNMGARDLPDMYAHGPQGIHIRQIMSAHVTSDMYHFRALLVRGQLLSSSSLTHTFAELLLKMHLRRFDCGLRISFQEHVLQMLSKQYSTIAHFALLQYKKRVLHCISVLCTYQCKAPLPPSRA